MMQMKITRMINILFVLSFYFISVLAFSKIVQLSPLAAFLLIPACVVFLIYIKKRQLGIANRSDSFCDRVWIGIWFLSFVMMIYMAFQLQVTTVGTWDWGHLIRVAGGYVLSGELQSKIYFARYPNNQFWLCCLILLFKVVKYIYPSADMWTFTEVSMLLGCVCVALTLMFLYSTARILWGGRKALLTGITAVLFAPLYMHAAFAYTDIPGMLVFMIITYLFVKYCREERRIKWSWLYIVAVGILSAVAWNIKITIFILIIAIVITALLQMKNWKKLILGLLIAGVSFSVSFIFINMEKNHFFQFEDSYCDANEFPPTHWLMMSLNFGGYVADDVEYTASFPDYESKKEANWEQIKERLKQRGILGSLKYILCDKQSGTWGDPTFAGTYVVSLAPLNPNGFWQRICTGEGDHHWILLLYSSLYYGFMLLGLLLSGIYNLNSKNQPLLAMRIALIGIVLFLLIWECTSRYIIVFFPALILLACEGFIKFRSGQRKIKV